MEEDSVFYYRIHSPVLLVEFDHQAGQAFPQYKEHYKDHIHVIVRTPNGNDYGRDLLRPYYPSSPSLRLGFGSSMVNPRMCLCSDDRPDPGTGWI